jgi:hypothetical protein
MQHVHQFVSTILIFLTNFFLLIHRMLCQVSYRFMHIKIPITVSRFVNADFGYNEYGLERYDFPCFLLYPEASVHF